MVDRDKCQGHGKCYLVAASMFEPDPDDDWGKPRVLTPVIDAADEESVRLARKAVQSCPEGAVALVGEVTADG